MGVKKRVSAFLLAVLLSFGVCAVDYLKVDALEVGGGIVSWETANNFLFGLLGIAPTEKSLEESVDWDEWRSTMAASSTQYFIDHLSEADLPEGKTKDEAIQDWIFSVCNGNLDKLSPCWDLYKEWAESQVVAGNGSGGSSGTSLNTLRGFIDYCGYSDFTQNTFSSYISLDSNIDVLAGTLYKNSSGAITGFSLVIAPWTLSSVNVGEQTNYEFLDINGQYVVRVSFDLNKRKFNVTGSTSNSPVASITLYAFYTTPDPSIYNKEFFLDLVSNSASATAKINSMEVWSLEGSSTAPSFDTVTSSDAITNIDIINNYSTTTTQNVVSIDWDRIASMISDAVGTVTGSLDRTITDALDDAQEKVAAGTMSVSNYNDYVTEISNTYVYDITNETSITNPDSTVTGVISGNVENSEFVLKGLQYVFPFCIPWDIKDFVTLLVSDPVAPVIEYPIYNPVTDTDEIITIDFSLWENQVRIVRYIFDFLLIIGLLLLARSLIGAGGSD